MRIGIHTSHLNEPKADGIKVFLKNLILNIKKLAPKDEFFLYYKDKPKEGFVEAPNYHHIVVRPPKFFDYLPNFRAKGAEVKKFGRVRSRGPWTQLWLPPRLFKDKLDALFVPLQTQPFLRPKMKTVITIHDIAFFEFPEYFTLKNRTLLYLFSSYGIRSADKIVTPSQSTKNDIINHYKVPEEKVIVTPFAFNKEIFKPVPEDFNSQEILEKYHIKKPYILFVGVLQPRKNVTRLVQAFNILKKKLQIPHQLVLVSSKGWLYEDILKEIKKSPYKKDIIQTGNMPLSELPKLLWETEVFVLPSLYEGFGLPVLEALACGTPVVTSNNSSLPEVGGDAALYIENPKNETEIAEKILKVISNKDLQKEMRRKGFEQAKKFSWRKCAKQVLKVIKSEK